MRRLKSSKSKPARCRARSARENFPATSFTVGLRWTPHVQVSSKDHGPTGRLQGAAWPFVTANNSYCHIRIWKVKILRSDSLKRSTWCSTLKRRASNSKTLMWAFLSFPSLCKHGLPRPPTSLNWLSWKGFLAQQLPTGNPYVWARVAGRSQQNTVKGVRPPIQIVQYQFWGSIEQLLTLGCQTSKRGPESRCQPHSPAQKFVEDCWQELPTTKPPQTRQNCEC